MHINTTSLVWRSPMRAWFGFFMPRGSVSSTLRSAEQTSIARFHTEPPEGFWARNLRQFATASASLPDNARLLAMLSVAFRDAGNGCFESKYQYNFWRPLSATRWPTRTATRRQSLTCCGRRWWYRHRTTRNTRRLTAARRAR